MFGLSRKGKPDQPPEPSPPPADSAPEGKTRSYALTLEEALAARPELDAQGIAYEIWCGESLEPLWLSLPRPPRSLARSWLGDWLQARRGRRPAQVRRVSWEALPGLDLIPNSDQRLSGAILILSRDRVGLQQLLSEHVRLGEGEMAIAARPVRNGDEDEWLLQLQQPSYWLLAQHRPGRIFLASERPGLYIEQGYHLRHPRLLELLRWDSRQLLLLEAAGTCRELAVTWQPVRGLIDLALPAPDRFAPAPGLRLTIRPRLIPAGSSAQARLWRIDEPERLEDLLAEAAPEQLNGFRSFIAEQAIFCEQTAAYGDAGLAEALSQRFPAWQLLQRRVYLPLGLRLQPRLSEEELLRSLPPLQRNDHLCLSQQPDGAIGLSLLPSEGWQDLHRLLDYRLEAALERLDGFASAWDFELGELCERSRQQVYSLRSEAGVKPAATAAPVAEAAPVQPVPEPEAEPAFTPAVQSEQVLALRQAVRELDERLLEHFGAAALWRERAGLCERLKADKEALYCRALAAIIDQDQAALLALIAAGYPRLSPGLEALFGNASLDETAKGALLGQIRQAMPCAEDRYLLQLWYACRFSDADVFALTVEAMRRGEAVPAAAFHDFGLSDESRGDKQILMLDFGKEEALTTAIGRYTGMLRDCAPDLRAVAIEQFRVLLKAHHPQPARVDALLPQPGFPAQASPLWARKWAELQAWPEPFAEGPPSRAAAFWAGLVTLPGLQGARLQELFTGEAYRPDFTAEFRAEALATAEAIYRSYLNPEGAAQPPEAPRFSGTPGWWRDFFEPTSNTSRFGRQQRILLYLCQRYGPLADFEPFVASPDYRHLTDFSCFVRHCDGFRLSRLFEQNLDETVFFPAMIEGLTAMAKTNLIDFRDAAENLVSCLFLSRSSHRGDWLAIILHLLLREAQAHAGRADSERGEELLATLVHIQLEPLLAALSSGLENYQHALRRRALWMEHAHRLHREGLSSLSEAYTSLGAPA